MEFDVERNAFVLDSLDEEAVSGIDGTVWSADIAPDMLEIVMERYERLDAVDPSLYPAGSRRNEVLRRRERLLPVLDKMRQQLTSHVMGVEAEAFLNREG